MKKLMMALGIVALAVTAQAGTFKWGTNVGQYLYHASGASKLNSGTVYLFDANTISQAAMVTAFTGSGIDYSKAMDSTSITSSGTITAKSLDVTADQAYNMYLVIVDGENVYIGPEKAMNGPGEGKTSNAYFSTTASSKLAVVDTAYSAAGWYKAGSTPTPPTPIPEPTSGLLVLVGVAGFALKRKRA